MELQITFKATISQISSSICSTNEVYIRFCKNLSKWATVPKHWWICSSHHLFKPNPLPSFPLLHILIFLLMFIKKSAKHDLLRSEQFPRQQMLQKHERLVKALFILFCLTISTQVKKRRMKRKVTFCSLENLWVLHHKHLLVLCPMSESPNGKGEGL